MSNIPHNFQKIGGGKGRPSISALCSICGLSWATHSKTDKTLRTILARPIFKGTANQSTLEENISSTVISSTVIPSVVDPETFKLQLLNKFNRISKILEKTKTTWIQDKLNCHSIQDIEYWNAQYEMECL